MIIITKITASQYLGKLQVYFDINIDEINTAIYHWSALVPESREISIEQFLENNKNNYIADIKAKEIIWASLEPKTKEIVNSDGTTSIIPISKEEIVFPTLMQPENLFDIKQFFGRLIQVIEPNRWFTLSKLGVGWTMEKLIDYPNFEGLKVYINSCLADETINQDDYDKIIATLAEQNIDLDDY